MRPILLALALLFFAIGVFFLRASLIDPAPDEAMVHHEAAVESVDFRETKKFGHVMRLELVGVDELFAVSLIDRVEGLETRLAERVVPGIVSRVSSMPRVPDTFGHDASFPMTILALSVGQDELITRETFDTPMSRAIELVVPIMGALAVAFGLALAIAAQRLR